uniref:AlNc14C32G2926 protein n=1 Tax=Albugo laibachii Nc14 TaxID=890382 RepID=F0W7X6_9STRA|nr:AlNc14C32G2926 [Albugo laibachii Nc14]|eukprot:CCA17229.1 AlNc14C32G2926 [Albugo laibachii Nc14]
MAQDMYCWHLSMTGLRIIVKCLICLGVLLGPEAKYHYLVSNVACCIHNIRLDFDSQNQYKNSILFRQFVRIQWQLFDKLHILHDHAFHNDDSSHHVIKTPPITIILTEFAFMFCFERITYFCQK